MTFKIRALYYFVAFAVLACPSLSGAFVKHHRKLHHRWSSSRRLKSKLSLLTSWAQKKRNDAMGAQSVMMSRSAEHCAPHTRCSDGDLSTDRPRPSRRGSPPRAPTRSPPCTSHPSSSLENNIAACMLLEPAQHHRSEERVAGARPAHVDGEHAHPPSSLTEDRPVGVSDTDSPKRNLLSSSENIP
jgi:hypothetical protein